MIPAQAVEAGWTAYLASERDGLDRIRSILEAAAPYMQADDDSCCCGTCGL